MGLGGTAKKLQTLTDTAEKLYQQLVEIKDRIVGLEETTDKTQAEVEAIAAQLDRHEAILEALAEEHDLALDEETE